jgi:hypothetical protein
MATPTKGKTLHLYVQDEAFAHLAKLSDSIDMPQSTLAARLLSAALECASENGYRITLPLKFTMASAQPPPVRK